MRIKYKASFIKRLEEQIEYIAQGGVSKVFVSFHAQIKHFKIKPDYQY